MNLLYLIFGENINNHIQAHFSIYSFLTQGEKINSINVITDREELYDDVKEFIRIIHIDEATLNEWKGEHNFFWRIKIKAIEMLCHQYKSEPVVYLDADTFLFGNIDELNALLKNNKALMHENEGAVKTLKDKTNSKMYRQTINKKFGNALITNEHKMWNAGVVGTPNTSDGNECTTALQICDDMCRQNVTPRLIEQFALSVALQITYGLSEAKIVIGHYWSNKSEWEKAIKEFLITAQFKKHNTREIISSISKFDLSAIPIKVKERNTNQRIKKLADKAFPNQNITYIQK